MASIRRAALRSIEASSSDYQQREVELQSVTNPAKRAGLTLLHRTATKYPKEVSAVLRLGSAGVEVRKLPSGYISDVYKIGNDTVLKVHKDSVGLSHRGRKELAAGMRYEHEALVAYVGPAVLPHTIDIGPHPTHRFMQAVRITQPFVNIDFLKLDEEQEDIPLLADRLLEAKSACPTLYDELQTVITGSRALFADRQLSTDIMGINNVGIGETTRHLTIVDAQPVSSLIAEGPEAHNKIAAYLDNLETAIQIAA